MNAPWPAVSAVLTDIERQILREVEAAFERGRQALTVLAVEPPAETTTPTTENAPK